MAEQEPRGWARHPRYGQLLTKLQEEIDRSARDAREFPRDNPEYKRGYTTGVIRAKQIVGYMSQLTASEEAVLQKLVDGPEARSEMTEAEARLAAGMVASAEEVRARHADRFKVTDDEIRAAAEPAIDG